MSSKTFTSDLKKTLFLAVPVCIAQLGQVSVGVVDTFMAGRLGPLALASATFALSVQIPFLMLCLGFSYGLTPLISRAAGAGDTAACSIVLKNGLVLNIFFAFLLVTLLLFSTNALHHFKQPPEVLLQGIPFFRVLVLSLIPLQFYQVYKQFTEGLSLTRQAMYISISGNVLNILLNYLLIFGKGGFPALGLMGSAYATLIARLYMACAIFIYVRFNKRFIAYRTHTRTEKYSFSSMVRICQISLPIGVQLILETGAFGFAALMAGWLGVPQIGAHQIALSLASITYMAATGISSAATIRVGTAYGKRNFREIAQVGISTYSIILVFELLCTLVFIGLRDVLPQLYIAHDQIIALSSSLLLIAAFFQISDGIQVVGLGLLRGLGDVTIPTATAIISYWLIGLPLGYVFAFILQMGVQGIWYGLLAGLSVAAVLLFLRFRMKIAGYTKEAMAGVVL